MLINIDVESYLKQTISQNISGKPNDHYSQEKNTEYEQSRKLINQPLQNDLSFDDVKNQETENFLMKIPYRYRDAEAQQMILSPQQDRPQIID